MNTKMTVCILLSLCSLRSLRIPEAQQSGKIPRVGILFIGGRDQPHLQSFKQGLHERGYEEGKNIKLEYKYAEGKEERLDELAAEFVREKVDVIVTTASVSALAARKATQTIPIVMTSGSPIETGLAKSLARPGGNVTGLTVMVSDLSGKRLEILKETLPKMIRVGVLWTPREVEAKRGFAETETAAKAFSLRMYAAQVNSAGDFDRAFARNLQGPCRRLRRYLITAGHAQLEAHCRARHQIPSAGDVRHQTICRGGWPDGLRPLDRRSLPARGRLRRQDLERRQAGRSAGRATDEVRVHRQSESSQADRPDDSAERAGESG